MAARSPIQAARFATPGRFWNQTRMPSDLRIPRPALASEGASPASDGEPSAPAGPALQSGIKKNCYRAEVQSISVEERAAFVALQHIRAKIDGTQDMCPRCYMYLARKDMPGCICDRMTALTPPDDPLPHSLHLYTHFREHRRMSNTGKLLIPAFPDRVRVYLSCVPEEEEDFRRDLTDGTGAPLPNACLLFPSEDSIPIAEFLARLRETSGLPPDAPAPGLRLVLLDATWDQARALLRQCPVPGLPRVNVDTRLAKSLFHPARRQPLEGRMSTLEAAALALEAAGVEARLWEPLYGRLKFAVDAWRLQRHRDPVYGELERKPKKKGQPKPKPPPAPPASTSGDVAAILSAMGLSPAAAKGTAAAAKGPAPAKAGASAKAAAAASAREAMRLFHSSPFRPGGAFDGSAKGGCACCGDEVHHEGHPEEEEEGAGGIEGDRFVREAADTWY